MGQTAVDQLEELLQEQWRLINQLQRKGIAESRSLFVSNQRLKSIVDGLKERAAQRGLIAQSTPSTPNDLVQFRSLVKD